VLNLSGNALAALGPLTACHALETVNLSDNALASPAAVVPLIAGNPNLYGRRGCVVAGQTHLCVFRCRRVLQVAGNPLCAQPKYQDPLIAAANALEALDGREITAAQRAFLMAWQQQKQQLQYLQQLQLPPSKSPPPNPGPFGKALDAFDTAGHVRGGFASCARRCTCNAAHYISRLLQPAPVRKGPLGTKLTATATRRL
jgi:hypothetical protein